MCKAAFDVAKMGVLGRRVSPKVHLGKVGPFGLPVKLHRLASWLSSPTVNLQRLALTVLNGYRLLECRPKADYESIESPAPTRWGWEFSILLEEEVDQMLKFHSGDLIPRKPAFETLLFTKGPYGSKGSFEYVTAAACVLAASDPCATDPQRIDVLGAVLDLGRSRGLDPEEIRTYLLQCAARPYEQSLAAMMAFQNKRPVRRQPSTLVRLTKEVERGLEDHHTSGIYELLTDDEKLASRVEVLEDVLHSGDYGMNAIDDGPNWLEPYFAKLSFIRKEGGGSRPITPVNYFVQDALKPYHDKLMSLLRCQPSDCTYDESHAQEFMRACTRAGQHFSGFDWSSATDLVSRRYFLYPVVKVVYGRRVADAWEKLMRCSVVTNRPERKYTQYRHSKSTPLGGPNVDTTFARTIGKGSAGPASPIFYRNGAPMGLYALWPVFALGHHGLCRIALRLALIHGGFTPPDDLFDVIPGLAYLFDKGSDGQYTMKPGPLERLLKHQDRPLTRRELDLYRCKGDDIGIKGRRFAYFYRILCFVQEIALSKMKSITPFPGLPHAAEMVKTIYRDGVDLTPISPKALKSAFVDRATLGMLGIVARTFKWFGQGAAHTYISGVRRTLQKMVGERQGGFPALLAFISAPMNEHKYALERELLSATGFWPDLPRWCYAVLYEDANRALRYKLRSELVRAFKGIELPVGVILERDRLFVPDDHPALRRCGVAGAVPVPPDERTIALLIREIQDLSVEDLVSSNWEAPRALDVLMRACSFARQLKSLRHRAYSFSFLSRPIRTMSEKARSAEKRLMCPRPYATRVWDGIRNGFKPLWTLL